MPLIGNRTHAAEIAEWFTNLEGEQTCDCCSPSVDATSDLPSGWKLLGSGSYRYVYQHIASGVCYKVAANEWGDTAYENGRELHNTRILRKMGDAKGFVTPKFRIPATSGYRVSGMLLLAMETIQGYMHQAHWQGHRRAAQGRADLFHIGKFADMHSMNYIIERGSVVVPIDLASERVRNPVWYADLRAIDGLPLHTEVAKKRKAHFNYPWL